MLLDAPVPPLDVPDALAPWLARRLPAVGATSAAALLAVAALAGGPAQGAVRLETTTQLQRSAERVWPTPHEATGDRSRAHTDGCLVGFGFPRSPPCVYGHKRGRTTLVLFGDRHVLQYFSAFERVALDRRWRLVLLAKAGCALGPRHTRIVGRVNRACSAWREHSLRRIARLPKPTLVVATGATYYHLYEDGRRLDPAPLGARWLAASRPPCGVSPPSPRASPSSVTPSSRRQGSPNVSPPGCTTSGGAPFPEHRRCRGPT